MSVGRLEPRVSSHFLQRCHDSVWEPHDKSPAVLSRRVYIFQRNLEHILNKQRDKVRITNLGTHNGCYFSCPIAKGFARSRANQEKGSTAPRVLIYYILWCTDSTGVPFSQQLTQDPRAVRTCRRRVGSPKT